jgi:hypothetical protein
MLVATGCASSPEGTAELAKRVDGDLKAVKTPRRNISDGRPMFAEVQSYPQILPSGDIWMGGDILLNIGREEMNISELVDRYSNANSKAKGKDNSNDKTSEDSKKE